MNESSSQKAGQVHTGKGKPGSLINWVLWGVFQAIVAVGIAAIIWTTPAGIPGVSISGFGVWAVVVGALGILISIFTGLRVSRARPESQRVTADRRASRATLATVLLLLSQLIVDFAATCENGVWSQLMAPAVVIIAALLQVGALMPFLFSYVSSDSAG